MGFAKNSSSVLLLPPLVRISPTAHDSLPPLLIHSRRLIKFLLVSPFRVAYLGGASLFFTTSFTWLTGNLNFAARYIKRRRAPHGSPYDRMALTCHSNEYVKIFYYRTRVTVTIFQQGDYGDLTLVKAIICWHC